MIEDQLPIKSPFLWFRHDDLVRNLFSPWPSGASKHRVASGAWCDVPQSHRQSPIKIVETAISIFFVFLPQTKIWF